MSNSKFRSLVWIDVGRRLEDALNNYSSKHNKEGLTPSCISCEKFRESDEYCTAFYAKPPARIIAFGCSSYLDKDQIPF